MKEILTNKFLKRTASIGVFVSSLASCAYDTPRVQPDGIKLKELPITDSQTPAEAYPQPPNPPTIDSVVIDFIQDGCENILIKYNPQERILDFGCVTIFETPQKNIPLEIRPRDNTTDL